MLLSEHLFNLFASLVFHVFSCWCLLYVCAFATFMNYKEGMIFTVTLNSLAKIQCQPFPSLPRSAQLCFNHQVCRSVGWSVCHNHRKGWEVTIPRSYQSTCYLLVRMSVRFFDKGICVVSFFVRSLLIQSWIQRIEKENVIISLMTFSVISSWN